MKRAIALYSGGLDSTLVIALMKRAGVDVLPINFTSPFGGTHGLAGDDKKAAMISETFGLTLRQEPIDDELVALVKSPRFGWGKHLNPCIDCHLLMIRKTKALLQELQADFVVTGEVLGQRPMSQHRQALEMIAKKSELEGRLLRPLSAKLLTPTLPETEGWVSQENLLDISGRGRKRQLALAKEMGVETFLPPAGGCLLTDAGYSRKLKDLLAEDMITSRNCGLIRFGRYFNLGNKAKLVVARNEQECLSLEGQARPNDLLFYPEDGRGPTAVLRGSQLANHIEKAASIVAHYCRHTPKPEITVQAITAGERSRLRPPTLPEAELRALLIS